MDTTIEVDEHKRVGPYPDMYGHGPVTLISPHDDPSAELFICLDCGYTATDNRQFAHEDCNREDNRINQTWREWFEKYNAEDLPTAEDE